MKFSLWPSNDRAAGQVLADARKADAGGWYGVWLADHYMPDTGTTTPARGDIHECWALLPAVAAVTERVRVGTLVSPTSVHHPALLANRAATLDQCARLLSACRGPAAGHIRAPRPNPPDDPRRYAR